MLNYSKVLSINFIGCLTRKGFRSRAVRVFFSALGKLKSETLNSGALFRVMENVRSYLFLKKIKVAGIRYPLPLYAGFCKSTSMSLRSLIFFSNQRNDFGFYNRLFLELLDGFENKGNTVYNKESIYFTALDNRAFMHYLRRKKKKYIRRKKKNFFSNKIRI